MSEQTPPQAAPESGLTRSITIDDALRLFDATESEIGEGYLRGDLNAFVDIQAGRVIVRIGLDGLREAFREKGPPEEADNLAKWLRLPKVREALKYVVGFVAGKGQEAVWGWLWRQEASEQRYPFRLEIRYEGWMAVAGFSSTTGLSHESAVIEYRTGDEERGTVPKSSDLRKFGKVVLHRGSTQDLAMLGWLVEAPSHSRASADVFLVDKGKDVFQWRLENALPTRVEVGDVAADGREMRLIELELDHEGASLMGPV